MNQDKQKQNQHHSPDLFGKGTWDKMLKALDVTQPSLPPRTRMVFDEERRASVQHWVDALQKEPCDEQPVPEAAGGWNKVHMEDMEMIDNDALDKAVTPSDSISSKNEPTCRHRQK